MDTHESSSTTASPQEQILTHILSHFTSPFTWPSPRHIRTSTSKGVSTPHQATTCQPHSNWVCRL